MKMYSREELMDMQSGKQDPDEDDDDDDEDSQFRSNLVSLFFFFALCLRNDNIFPFFPQKFGIFYMVPLLLLVDREGKKF